MKSFEQQVTDVRCTLPSMACLRCDVMLNFPWGLKLLSCKMKREAATSTPNFMPAMSRCDRVPSQGPVVRTEESSRLSDRPKDMEDSQIQHNELSFKPQTSSYLLCKPLHHSAYEVHVHWLRSLQLLPHLYSKKLRLRGSFKHTQTHLDSVSL